MTVAEKENNCKQKQKTLVFNLKIRRKKAVILSDKSSIHISKKNLVFFTFSTLNHQQFPLYKSPLSSSIVESLAVLFD